MSLNFTKLSVFNNLIIFASMYILPRFKLYNRTKMGWHKYLRIYSGQMKADDKHTANDNLKPSLLRFWGFENSDAGHGALGKLGVSATISGFAQASSVKAGPPVSVQKGNPLTLQRYSVAESAPDHVRSCIETARSTTSRLRPWDPYIAPRAGLQSTARLIKLPSSLKTQEVVFSTCSVGDPCLPAPGFSGERGVRGITGVVSLPGVRTEEPGPPGASRDPHVHAPHR